LQHVLMIMGFKKPQIYKELVQSGKQNMDNWKKWKHWEKVFHKKCTNEKQI
jgi:hypothetical protein